ncbi:probable bifunctional dTTP/UTP pyrophosphatase/methyltransferase protein [Suncus etruscus]|uniref:probable bifunctional dTTP/UTP pyrophosphatase/methyltransferase protein n=1 Tax=Suncus etruscus TaxID=109475 RepID=UPI00210F3CEF|nr:probable bifunctional dTTP/UTP pyrophosphatase/methyltransferase protein [Suncus etruscus]
MELCPVLGKLLHQRVVLASASPRRQEILNNVGLRFEVVPSRFKETLDKAAFPEPYEYATATARGKALEVARRLRQKDLRAPDMVIGADTIVAVDGLILEKPVDKQDAYNMLSKLNGQEHSVFTGVAIVRCRNTDGRLDTDISEFFEETRVKFSQLSEALLWEYINSGEPMDKAGGYGIQALGGMLVERVHGDFLNVVGFPLNHFCKRLAQLYLPGPQAQPDPAVQVQVPAASSRASTPQDQDALPPFPARLLQLIEGFRTSKVLFRAWDLGVFDSLKEEAPQTAEALATRTHGSESDMEQLLDACVALGLLEKMAAGYSNSACARRHLCLESEDSLNRYVWLNMRPAWDLATRMEARDLQHPCGVDAEERIGVLRSLHNLGRLVARHVAAATDLGAFGTACDLGGSTGALADELARKYPRMTVTVFDVPGVTQHSAEFRPDEPWKDRVRFQAGDIFSDPLPAADLYVVSCVLHPWADDKLDALFVRVAATCKPALSPPPPTPFLGLPLQP